MIVIDDLHELRNPECHDVLSIVIGGVPPGSQFVAASRGEQPHLAQARASGESVEITPTDLAFDAVAARTVFAAAETPLTAETAATVIQRTEGWPVGVFLAAAIARDGGDISVTGDDRYVADYLYQEALMKLPPHLQEFVRRTAVVDRMTAPLCDALLGADDSQAVLRELEAEDVFLIALDRRRGWYRYHELFREFLLSELRRVEPRKTDELHLAAADWFEQNGSPTMAIEHLLAVPAERARATQLVSATALGIYQAGLMTTVQRWCDALGDEAVEGYPPLAVIAGWMALLTGHAAAADRWAVVLEGSSYDGVPIDGSASFESGRAMLRSFMCALGPEHALKDAEFAVAAEAATSPWRDQALYLLGEAQLLCGRSGCRRNGIPRGVDRRRSAGERRHPHRVRVGVGDADDGQRTMGRSGAHVRAALDTIDQASMQDYAISTPVFVQAARMALHRGDLPDVHQQVTRAMRARPGSTYAMPYLAVRARLELAKVYWALSDHTTAHHLMREIEDIVLHRPDLGALIDQVADFRTTDGIEHGDGQQAGPPLTPAELRLLPYLQTHLTMGKSEAVSSCRETRSVATWASVYRKLGVSTRSEAVQRATEMGLLGA